MTLEQLGPYKIIRPLGLGGMGAVYQGVHKETGESAALKVLAAPLAADEGFRERFEVEIETLRKLSHPNIVRLLGFGQESGHLYYVMELVEGGSLEQELRRGRRFSWREVVDIGTAMCRALRHAHDRGVIHRDIKPGNVLFALDGVPKLSDFGIARLFGQSRLTGPGNVLGTAEYMAPEQAAGGVVDARSDLYSLGSVMYTLLALRPPFEAGSMVEVLHLLRTAEPPPLGSAAADAPESLQAVVRQLLRKDPNARFATATALGHRLQAILEESADLPAAAASEAPSLDPAAAELPSTSPMSRSDWLPPSRPAPFAAPAEEDAVSPVAAPQVSPGELPTTEHRLPSPAAAPPQYVRVTPRELDASVAEPTSRTWISLQTLLLAAAFCASGWLLWRFVQPVDADALYARIAARAADTEAKFLTETDKHNFDDFLQRFSGDPRAAKVQQWKTDLDLTELDWRYEGQAAGKRGKGTLLPIERDYLAALQLAWFDPEKSAAQLQAMLDLYASQQGKADQAGRCLTLVRRRLDRLHADIRTEAEPRLAAIREQLALADAAAHRDPARALQIWRAVTTLYGDKPWAKAETARAEAGLKRLPGAVLASPSTKGP